jgi:hypothetical protein
VAVDSSGNIYIADEFNHRIRVVDAVTGNISTIAGDGTASFGGDGGPATAAQLNTPVGLAVGGTVLFIADLNNHRIRLVDLVSGIIATVAGNGTAGFSGDGGPAIAAQLNGPWDIAAGFGQLFIADTGNHRVRLVDVVSGNISTVAGDGTASWRN